MPSPAGASSARGRAKGAIHQTTDLTCLPDQRWLWVGGLLPAVSNEDLHAEFSRFGIVERAFVGTAGHASCSLWHAYILFKDKSDAQQALIKARDGSAHFSDTLGKLKLEWARSESKPSQRSPTHSAPKAYLPSGFVCICTHKSVQLDDASHFTRDTHDQQLHDEMEAGILKDKGANVQTMYLPGGGLMAVNPNKNLVIGARAHRMAVFMGKLTNYVELIQKHNVPQPKHSDKGKPHPLTAPELLCILYSKLGLAMLSELQGKYAFCMYDPRLVRVLAVRDPSGTFPIVQAYTEHDNLLIVCGPYLPEGHREVIELQPSEYKYGWHAPPLHYDGGLPPVDEAEDEAAHSEAAKGRKRRSRHSRRNKASGAKPEAAEVDAAGADATEQKAAAAAVPQADAHIEQEQQEAGNAAARKARRRRPRRKPAAAAAAQDGIVLPDNLDECGGVPQEHEDSTKQQDIPQQPREQQEPADQPAGDAQQSASGAGSRPSRQRRRRNSSCRTSFDSQQQNANGVTDGQVVTQQPPQKSRRSRGRHAWLDCNESGDTPVQQQGQPATRPQSAKAGGSRRSVSANSTDQVWVPKGATASDGTSPNANGISNGTSASSKKVLHRQIPGLSSHKISVGQDLDNLGNMLVAGLAGASLRGIKRQSALAGAITAVKPSHSCGDLNNLHASNGNGAAKLVC